MMGDMLTSLLILGLLVLSTEDTLQNRPDETATLANALRGSWTSTDKAGDGAPAAELWGRWILGGHFVELEWVDRTEPGAIRQAKLILRWDAPNSSFQGWHFDADRGEVRTSSWRKTADTLLSEVTAPQDSFRLEDGGTKLILTTAGRSLVFRLSDR
jgi:hypothetical protein